jgi:pilus assembly protein CpaC
MPGDACPIGATPRPGQQVLEKQGRFVKELIDPEMCLDLIVSRTRLMVLKETPKRVQIADEGIASYTLVTPTELSLLGKSTGVTILTVWFQDPTGREEVLTYQIRVLPDPEAKERLERVYRSLADQINHTFPDSVVYLSVVGDKVVVTGHVKDIAEAAQIMRIIRCNVPGGVRTSGVARIPVDRMRTGRAPGDPANDLNLPLGLDSYLSDIENPNVINLLHVPGEQQVLLRVTLAEVNRSAARSIGLDFSITNDHGVTVFQNNTGSIATGGITGVFTPFGGFGVNGAFGANGAIAGVAVGPGGFNNLPTRLDNGEVSLAISALRTLNYARLLAEPNLVTMNGQTATFQAGGEFPVPVLTSSFGTSGTLQGINFLPLGVYLYFTPYITDHDRVRLVLNADVSSRDLNQGNTLVNGTAIPNLITRNLQTTVELREGQTLAVAGLIQNSLGANSTRVPGIGDLPVIGHLFGFDQLTAGETELVLLVTPELVHPLEPHEVPALPGSDLFEPDDCEFYLLGRIESHNHYDFRSPVMTDCDRRKHYRNYETTHINGPHGNSEPHGNTDK